MEKILNKYYFFAKNFNWQINDFIIKISKKYNNPKYKILDIGSGYNIYKKYFDKAEFKTLDIKQNKYKNIDLVCDVNKKIPIKNNSYDVIISTQVLEHLKNPHIFFAKTNKILKKNGKLFLTTNYIYEPHLEPFDYFRFTKFGLKMLAQENGFKVIKIKSQGGLFQVFFHLFVNTPFYLFFKKNGIFYYLYFLILFIPLFFIGIIFYFLDFLDIKKIMTLNFEMECKKID